MVIFYFSVSSFPKYGMLSKRTKEKQIAGSRVAIENYKKNPRLCFMEAFKRK